MSEKERWAVSVRRMDVKMHVTTMNRDVHFDAGVIQQDCCGIGSSILERVVSGDPQATALEIGYVFGSCGRNATAYNVRVFRKIFI